MGKQPKWALCISIYFSTVTISSKIFAQIHLCLLAVVAPVIIVVAVGVELIVVVLTVVIIIVAVIVVLGVEAVVL